MPKCGRYSSTISWLSISEVLNDWTDDAFRPVLGGYFSLGLYIVLVQSPVGCVMWLIENKSDARVFEEN